MYDSLKIRKTNKIIKGKLLTSHRNIHADAVKHKNERKKKCGRIDDDSERRASKFEPTMGTQFFAV